MESKLYHCWYSAQQAEHPSVAINQYRLTTGETATVTQLGETEKCPALWDDMIYLGQTFFPDGFVGVAKKAKDLYEMKGKLSE